MADTQGGAEQSGRLDEQRLHELLRQQGITNLDDLVRRVVQETNTRGGLHVLQDDPDPFVVLADTDKWALVIK